MHQALADDEDVRAYVADLEKKSDDDPSIIFDVGDMADEVENFLRNQEDD